MLHPRFRYHRLLTPPVASRTAGVTVPSEILALIVAVLAVCGSLVHLFQAVVAMIALPASIYGFIQFGLSAWPVLIGPVIQSVNAVGGVLLLGGAIGLLTRRNSGRRMIIAGCLLVIGLVALGWLVGMVFLVQVRSSFNGLVGEAPGTGSFFGEAMSLVSWINVASLIFPTLTAILVTRPGVRAFCSVTAAFKLSNAAGEISTTLGQVRRAASAPRPAGPQPWPPGQHLPIVGPPPQAVTPPTYAVTAPPHPVTNPPEAAAAPPRAKVDLVKRPTTPPVDTGAAPTNRNLTAQAFPGWQPGPGEPRPRAVGNGPFPANTYAPAPPPAPRRPSAFGRIPRRDRAQDAAAVILIIAALTGPWNLTTVPIRGQGSALGLTGIFLTSLLVIAAVSVPYLRVAFAVESVAESPLDPILRQIAAAAYALVALTFVIGDMLRSVSGIAESGYRSGLGVGPAISLAAAGALLAIAPRTGVDTARWITGASTAMWVAAGWILASGLAALIEVRISGRAVSMWPPVVVAFVVALCTIIGAGAAAATASGLSLRYAAWRLALIGCGGVVIVAGIVSSVVRAWPLEGFGGKITLFLPAWAAAGVCAWIAGSRSPEGAAAYGWTWLGACRNALLIGFAFAATEAVVLVGEVTAQAVGGHLSVRDPIAAVLALVSAAALVAAASQLRPLRHRPDDPRPSRPAAMIASGTALISGIMSVAVGSYGLWMIGLVVLGIPTAVLATLLIATPIRHLYGLGPLAIPGARSAPAPVPTEA